MSYLGLTKQMIQNELSEERLIECLEIPNIAVVQHSILKILEKRLNNDKIHMRKKLDKNICP